MSDTDIDLFEDDDSAELPKKLRKQIKEIQKERDEMREQLASFQQKERRQMLSSTLQERGFNPKIAAFVPSDVEGEALDSWLDEYGDVFGAGGTSEAEQEQAQPVIARDAAEAQAIRQMSQADATSPPVGAPEDLLAQINGAENMEDLMRALGR